MTTPQSQSIDSVFTEENVDTLLEECAMPGLIEGEDEAIDCKSLLRLLNENQEKESDDNEEEEKVEKTPPLGRLQQRQKQIRIGKSTYGYQQYALTIPKENRGENDMETPPTSPSSLNMSKRNWDKELRKWRKYLHHFDKPQEAKEEQAPLATAPMAFAMNQDTLALAQKFNYGSAQQQFVPFLGAPLQSMVPISYIPVQQFPTPMYMGNHNGMFTQMPNTGA